MAGAAHLPLPGRSTPTSTRASPPASAIANFTTDGVDVGIRLSSGVHPDLHVEKLSDEWMLPLCSPRLLEGEHAAALAARSAALPPDPDRPAGHGADLGRLARAPSASHGIDTTRGLRLNVADHALDAASEGAGVVLGYKLVASRDIGSRPPGRRRSGRSCRCRAAPTISCAPRARRRGRPSRPSATGCSPRSRTPSPHCGRAAQLRVQSSRRWPRPHYGANAKPAAIGNNSPTTWRPAFAYTAARIAFFVNFTAASQPFLHSSVVGLIARSWPGFDC